MKYKALILLLIAYQSVWANKYDIMGAQITQAFNCSHLANFSQGLIDSNLQEGDRLLNYGYEVGKKFLNNAPSGKKYQYLHTDIRLIHALENVNINGDFFLGERYGETRMYMVKAVNRGVDIFTSNDVISDIRNKAYAKYLSDNCMLLGGNE